MNTSGVSIERMPPKDISTGMMNTYQNAGKLPEYTKNPMGYQYDRSFNQMNPKGITLSNQPVRTNPYQNFYNEFNFQSRGYSPYVASSPMTQMEAKRDYDSISDEMDYSDDEDLGLYITNDSSGDWKPIQEVQVEKDKVRRSSRPKKVPERFEESAAKQIIEFGTIEKVNILFF